MQEILCTVQLVIIKLTSGCCLEVFPPAYGWLNSFPQLFLNVPPFFPSTCDMLLWLNRSRWISFIFWAESNSVNVVFSVTPDWYSMLCDKTSLLSFLEDECFISRSWSHFLMLNRAISSRHWHSLEMEVELTFVIGVLFHNFNGHF